MDWQRYLKPEAWHPAAKLFELMPEKELCELARDIAEKGQLEPVILLEDKVLDGRNRLIACDKAGKEPWIDQWRETKMTPTEWVLSKNLRRRHLSPSQAAMVAAGAMDLLEEEARERKEATGKYAPRDEQGKLKPVPQMFGEPASGKHSGEAAQKAAIFFNTNRQYIQDAKLIGEKDPELAKAIKRGEITIPQAKKKLGLVPQRWTITLHPEFDKDIIDYYPKETRSEAVREALRFYMCRQYTERPCAPSRPGWEPGGRKAATEEGAELLPKDTGRITTLEEAEEEMDKIIEEIIK